MKPASPSYLRTFKKRQTASPKFYKILSYNQLHFSLFWFSVLRQTENQSQANDFPFSAKRFFILSRTIFHSQQNDFSFSAERKKAFCNPYTLFRYPEKRSLKKGMASHEAIPFKFLKKYPPSTPTKRISVSASARFNLPATDNANWRPSSVPALHGGIWQTPIWPSASPATNNCRSRAGLLRELPLHIPQ